MRAARFFLISCLVVIGCHRAAVDNPAVPPVTVRPAPPAPGVDYSQKLLDTGPIVKKRLAVARFGDNRTVEQSPFGRKNQLDVVGPGVSIHREELEPEGEEPGSAFTAKLIDALARTNRFILIERKDVNAVLRELSFGKTSWADREKSARAGRMLGAQIIVTGSIGWNDDSTRSSEPLMLLMRIYDVETGRIVGTARAAGKTEREIIDRAVSEITLTMEK